MTRPEPAFTPDAHADVLQAFEYYNAQSPNLGFEFLDELEDTASIIRETPLIFTTVDPPIRRARVHRFPYGVFYVSGVTAARAREASRSEASRHCGCRQKRRRDWPR